MQATWADGSTDAAGSLHMRVKRRCRLLALLFDHPRTKHLGPALDAAKQHFLFSLKTWRTKYMGRGGVDLLIQKLSS